MASTAYEWSVVYSGRQAYVSYTGEILLTQDLACFFLVKTQITLLFRWFRR